MPAERLLMCLRRPATGQPEAEPVVVVCAPDGSCELTTDEGVVYVFDLAELQAAITDGQKAA